MKRSELPSTEFRRHPREVARCDFHCRVPKQAGLLACSLAILEGGACDGWFVRRLLEHVAPATAAVAWDAEYGSDILATLAASGPPGQRVERKVRSRGHLLLGVPAWQAPDAAHDRGLGHVRRYRLREARAGLELPRFSWWTLCHKH